MKKFLVLIPLCLPLQACSDGSPGISDVQHAVERARITPNPDVQSVGCIPAAEGPDRFKGIGYYCEFIFEDPSQVGGPFNREARFFERDGQWQAHGL